MYEPGAGEPAKRAALFPEVSTGLAGSDGVRGGTCRFELWLHSRQNAAAGVRTVGLESWSGWHPPPWAEVLAASRLPVAESSAAIFNTIINPFPLAALGAFLFLYNYRSCQAVVCRSLLRHGGFLAGGLAHGGLVLCALAALCKPVAFYLLSQPVAWIGQKPLVKYGELVDALSFCFEYLLGIGVQTYILLIAFAWVRGLTFDAKRLRQLALRRFASVGKWAFVVLILSGFGILLPLVLGSFHPQSNVACESVKFTLCARWLLATVLVLFCPVQLGLILHNESLRFAVLESLQFWRWHGWQVGWLILLVAFHFALLAITNLFLPQALGQWTWLASAWTLLLYPLVWSGCAGWFLASWVCLFRHCEGRSLEHADLVEAG